MEQISERARAPVRLGYRAVGSGTGQLEFLGNTTVPDNDFGAGDIPLSSEDFRHLQDSNIGMVHLPVMMGAVSFFHSLPNVPNLNLTSCLLAKIFKRDITEWDNAEILAENPELEIPEQGFPIHVARRVFGSSSTAIITQYLNNACPNEWTLNLVGRFIDWPAGTKECIGSAGMAACIQNTPGTIGYLHVGQGNAVAGILEARLQNRDGNFITSSTAARAGGIAAAGESAIPTNLFRADSDFGSIDLLNQPGPFTWPIVDMTYIYVRKDLSHIYQPGERALLISFLKSLYREEYISECEDLFGFFPVGSRVRELALDGIRMLESNLDSSITPEFSFEFATEPRVGMGEFVISGRRKTNAQVERDQIITGMGELQAQITQLQLELMRLRQEYEAVQNELSMSRSQTKKRKRRRRNGARRGRRMLKMASSPDRE